MGRYLLSAVLIGLLMMTPTCPAAPVEGEHDLNFVLSNLTALWEEVHQLRHEVEDQRRGDSPHDQATREVDVMKHEELVHHYYRHHEGHNDHHDPALLQHLEHYHNHTEDTHDHTRDHHHHHHHRGHHHHHHHHPNHRGHHHHHHHHKGQDHHHHQNDTTHDHSQDTHDHEGHDHSRDDHRHAKQDDDDDHDQSGEDENSSEEKENSGHDHSGDDHDHSGDDHDHSGDDHDNSEDDHDHSGDDHHHSGDDHHHSRDDHHHSGDDHHHSGDDHHHSGDDHNHSGDYHNHSGDDHNHSGDDHNHSGDDHNQSGDEHNQSGDDHNYSGGDHDHSGDDHSTDHHHHHHHHHGKDFHDRHGLHTPPKNASLPRPVVAGSVLLPKIGLALIPGRDGLQAANQEDEWMHAICSLEPNADVENGTVRGTVVISQKKDESGPVFFHINIHGFKPSDGLVHGFHIHESPVSNNSCVTAGSHLNPFGTDHGGPGSEIRHVGDLGNIEVDSDGKLENYILSDNIVAFNGSASIIGKAIVVHAGEDDLGLGGDEGSLTTGNAGGRLACCNIHIQAETLYRFKGYVTVRPGESPVEEG